MTPGFLQLLREQEEVVGVAEHFFRWAAAAAVDGEALPGVWGCYGADPSVEGVVVRVGPQSESKKCNCEPMNQAR